jgi:magnesium-transporting ATPase (P-type)
MNEWLIRVALAVIALAIAALTISSLPTLADHHMEGQRLMAHMFAGSVLVFAMPAFAILFLSRAIIPGRSAGLQRIGYWSLIVTSLIAIASVLLCMIPLLSTEQMVRWMTLHGYAGLATAPALLLLLVGSARWRRMKAMRSETPG